MYLFFYAYTVQLSPDALAGKPVTESLGEAIRLLERETLGIEARTVYNMSSTCLELVLSPLLASDIGYNL